MKKEKVPLKTQLTNLVTRLTGFVSIYRLTLMVVLFGVVVGFALFRASTYSNIPRNESKFEELTGQSKVVKIDTELIDRIRASVDDEDPSIGENTSPGRTNPFSE